MNVMIATKKAFFVYCLSFVIFFLLWTLVVCYPNPYIFFRNFARYMRFPVDPSVIELFDGEIPDDPAEVEKFVLDWVEYEYDWKNYSVPWYVPTARDAVIRHKGDCESRAIVLASILKAKNIPYSLKASLVHIWVDYAGKRISRSENEGVAFVGKVDGKYRLKFPNMSQWRKYISAEKEMLWDVMPVFRKALLISGWMLIILAGCFLYRQGRIGHLMWNKNRGEKVKEFAED